MKRALVSLVIAVVGLASHAAADGGAVVDRGRYGAFDVTVFLAPIPPTTGAIEISMLIARSGEPQLDVAVRVRMVGPSGVVDEITLERSASGNRLLWSGPLDVDLAGVWKCAIHIGSDARDQGSFTLTVAPAPDHWVTMLPWMLIWIPVAVVIALRESLVARQRASRHAWVG